jgi:hypothetical protein
MHKALIAAAVLSVCAVTAADAGSRNKHQRHHTYQRTHVYPMHAYPAPPYAFVASSSRPVWAAPWQCFTDDGYGRYLPCEAGRR